MQEGLPGFPKMKRKILNFQNPPEGFIPDDIREMMLYKKVDIPFSRNLSYNQEYKEWIDMEGNRHYGTEYKVEAVKLA